MCRTQCLLALVALYVGLAHSWDIAVGIGNQLIFYTEGTKTKTVNFISRNVSVLAYDQVHNRMLYVDKQSNYDAICSFNLNFDENKCFINRPGNINSIAFDPATQTLFFTDTNDSSINSISLKPGSVNNVNANLLIKMDDRTPSDIAVDSCNGYIYWTNTINKKHYRESMERSKLNGSGREIIHREYSWLVVLTLVIDPLTWKIYYSMSDRNIDSKEYLYKQDLNGIDGDVIYVNKHYSAVQELTVSKDYLYWVNSSESYTAVWQLPKNAYEDKEPKKISTFHNEKQLAIATNYKIEDQIQGLQDCEALSSLIPIITVTNDSLNNKQTTDYTIDVELFCVHGAHVSETSVCNCTPGYIGERCEVSVCHNYCLQGKCSLNVEGLPTCRCNAGYSGKRCEMYVCYGYCWNDGACSLNEVDEPVCQCAGNYEGSRCETDTSDTTTDTPTYDSKIADLLSRWRKPSSKMFLTVEV